MPSAARATKESNIYAPSIFPKFRYGGIAARNSGRAHFRLPRDRDGCLRGWGGLEEPGDLGCMRSIRSISAFWMSFACPDPKFYEANSVGLFSFDGLGYCHECPD